MLSPKQGHYKEGGEGDGLIEHHPSFQKGNHDGHCGAFDQSANGKGKVTEKINRRPREGTERVR